MSHAMSPNGPAEPEAAVRDGATRRTQSRKAEHIRINLAEDVQSKGVTAGFEKYRFLHTALPEIDLADVATEVTVLGRRLGAPILISCMTGGTDEAGRINAALAEAANELRLPIGLGSGRVLLERPELGGSFQVRRYAPDTLLLANLGAVQFNRGYRTDDARRLVETLGADALVVHLNPLQEALQPEGDASFRGLFAADRGAVPVARVAGHREGGGLGAGAGRGPRPLRGRRGRGRRRRGRRHQLE